MHISLFNYRLKAQSCRSVIEIIDGTLESANQGNNHKKILHKMCSPIQRQARNQDGYFVSPQTFISTGSQIMVALKRFHSTSAQTITSTGPHDEEFIDGAYMFHDGIFMTYININAHDRFSLIFNSNFLNFQKFRINVHDIEEQSGTLQPYSLCDTHHYGLSSPAFGSISGQGTEYLYWNIEGALTCTHNFIAAANQSVILTVSTIANSQRYFKIINK